MPNPIGSKRRDLSAAIVPTRPTQSGSAAPAPASRPRQARRRSPESMPRGRRPRSPRSTLNAPATTSPALLAIDKRLQRVALEKRVDPLGERRRRFRLGAKGARERAFRRRTSDRLDAQPRPHPPAGQLAANIGNDCAVGGESETQHRFGGVLDPGHDTGPLRPVLIGAGFRPQCTFRMPLRRPRLLRPAPRSWAPAPRSSRRARARPGSSRRPAPARRRSR